MTEKRVIVYGAMGALGSTVVSTFKNQLNCWILAVDLQSLGVNSDVDASVLIKNVNLNSLVAQEEQVMADTKALLGENVKVDAIICLAGGWAGGNANSGDLIKNTDAMLKQSLWPSIICARIAALHLSSDGLVVLPGAKAALSSTPSMIGYGLAKAAVHHLVKSLSSIESGLSAESCVLALLPTILDTPMNRKWMPDANHSEWTPLGFVTDMLAEWTKSKCKRPKTGSLVVFEAKEISLVGD